MPHPRWQRIKELFAAASALPPEQREAMLRAQPDDAEVLDEVRSLLAAHSPTIGPAATGAAAAAGETPGSRIGPYKLLERIGEGGFGTVWMAEQETPVRRRVALKVVKAGMDTNQVVARFEQERQALALMDHPNIARIFDGGSTPGGRPFFVMELVKGDPITDYCDREKLTPVERLRLFTDVGRAVQHAHTKGVIHRDLKPSNVLVTIVDGKPVAKVIDFGVAKATQGRLTDKTLFTEHKQMIGTPLYMSPEQAHISGVDVDTRSDVYSLGVLLYELLTGTTPFRREELLDAGLAEMHRVLREVEPPKPSTRVATLGKTSGAVAAQRRVEVGKLGVMLRGDLDWIVMKCLEKERARRYETASALVKDVERHLAGEAVEAAPPSLAYRIRKLVRRKKGQVGAVASLSLVTLAFVFLSLWQAEQRATIAQAATTEQKRLTEQSEMDAYVASIQAANAALRSNDARTASRRLASCRERLRNWEWHYLNAASDQSVAVIRMARSRLDPEWGVDVARHWAGETADRWDAVARDCVSVPTGFTSDVLCATAIAGGARLVVSPGVHSPDLEVCDLVTGKLTKVATLAPTRESRVTVTTSDHVLHDPMIAGFSRDGAWLVTAFFAGGAELWDTRTWVRMRTLPDSYRSFAFSPDGSRLAMIGHRDPHLCDTATGGNAFDLVAHEGPVNACCYSPDGRLLATASDDRTCRVWDVATGHAIAHFSTGASNSRAVCFSADSERVIAGNHIGEIRVFDVATKSGGIRMHTDSSVYGIDCSSDNLYIAATAADGAVRIWDAATWRLCATLLGNEGLSFAPVFSPTSEHLVTTSASGVKRVWDATSWKIQLPSITVIDPLTCLDLAWRDHDRKALDTCWFSPDGRLLHVDWSVLEPATGALADDAHGTGSLTGFVTRPARRDVLLRGHHGPLLLSRSRESANHGVQVHDARSGIVLHEVTCDDYPHHASLGGENTLVTVSRRGTIELHDLATGAVRWSRAAAEAQCRVHASPNGELVLVESSRLLVIYDEAGTEVALHSETDSLGEFWGRLANADPWHSDNVIAWSPDSSLVAARWARNQLAVWDARSGDLVSWLAEHEGAVECATFSPNATRIVTGGDWSDKTLRVHEVATGRELLTLHDHDGPVTGVAFSPDGTLLASSSGDGTCCVRDSRSPVHSAAMRRNMVTARDAIQPKHAELVAGDFAGIADRLSKARLAPDTRLAASALACERYLHAVGDLETDLMMLLEPSSGADRGLAAIASLDRLRSRLDATDYMPTFWRALALYRAGRHAFALETLGGRAGSGPSGIAGREHALLTMIHARLGHRDLAERNLAEVRRQLEDIAERRGARAALPEVEAVFAECFPDASKGK